MRKLLLPAVVVALVLAGCGSDDDSSAPSDCTRIEGGKVTLVAKNLQWDTDCLRTDAGTNVTFTVKLEDEGVKHDLQVFGQGQKEQTPLTAGPATMTLQFDVAKPGRYQFVCTIHAQMEGELFGDEPRS